jgi:methionyl-tRNA formyltransferase
MTLMQMDSGLDTGPILAQRALTILPDSTTASLTPQLAQLGANLLIESLGRLIAGSIAPMPQNDRAATLTRPLVKADGWIDWNKPAVDIERQVRAMWDWPRGWTTLRGDLLQVHRAAVDPFHLDSPPGTIGSMHGVPAIATGAGRLILEIAQSAGSNPLPGAVWLQKSNAMGEVLGVSGAPAPPEIPMVRRALS